MISHPERPGETLPDKLLLFVMNDNLYPKGRSKVADKSAT